MGTSTAAEAKEYFSNLDIHRSTFVWSNDCDDLVDSNNDDDDIDTPGAADVVDPADENDRRNGGLVTMKVDEGQQQQQQRHHSHRHHHPFDTDADALMELVFSKSRAEDRKLWLERWYRVLKGGR